MITVILAVAALCWLSYEVCKRAKSETVGFWALLVCVVSGITDAIALVATLIWALGGWGLLIAAVLIVAAGTWLSIYRPLDPKSIEPGE
jgi:hypothetical protein